MVNDICLDSKMEINHVNGECLDKFKIQLNLEWYSGNKLLLYYPNRCIIVQSENRRIVCFESYEFVLLLKFYME